MGIFIVYEVSVKWKYKFPQAQGQPARHGYSHGFIPVINASFWNSWWCSLWQQRYPNPIIIKRTTRFIIVLYWHINAQFRCISEKSESHGDSSLTFKHSEVPPISKRSELEFRSFKMLSHLQLIGWFFWCSWVRFWCCKYHRIRWRRPRQGFVFSIFFQILFYKFCRCQTIQRTVWSVFVVFLSPGFYFFPCVFQR